MSLDFRYALAFTGGLIVISLFMMVISRIDEFLVYAFIFDIPFATLEKWLFLQPVGAAAKGINLGLSELLLLTAYSVWFVQIFVARTQPAPKLQKLDFCILLLLLVQGFSWLGAPNKLMATFDIVYNLKHMLIYFFILHKVKQSKLKTVIILLLVAIVLESGFAGYERLSGNIGIGLAKGNAQSEDFGTQYVVPGLESVRSAGTTQDSHVLGLYYALILPIPLVFMSIVDRTSVRMSLLTVFLVGLAGLFSSYSRSAWLSFGLSTSFAAIFMAYYWQRYFIIPFAVAAVIAVGIFYPQAYSAIYNRIVDAPQGIMDARYETYRTALDIWRQHPFLGYGPGNYFEAIDDPAILQQTVKGETGSNVYEIPVHNALLWIAADLGLLGVIAFFSIPVMIMMRCRKFLASEDILVRGFSLAVISALISYLLDGLTSPLFRDGVPYTQFWVYAAVIFSFPVVSRNNPAAETVHGSGAVS